MATTTLLIQLPPGQTGATLSLFPTDSDTADASGLSLTEQTNAKGWYTASVTGALSGMKQAVVFDSGGTAFASAYVYLEDKAEVFGEVLPGMVSRDLGRSTLHGPGADKVTLTITDGSGSVVADADVWITLDQAGQQEAHGTQQTDADGKVVFYLDDGATYYRWAQKEGYDFTNPQKFTAQKD